MYIFYVSGTAGAHQVDMQRVGAFVDNWTWCDEPVIIGCLVDVVRGCVTFRLNGIDGPCVRFPGFPWQSGVRLGVDSGAGVSVWPESLHSEYPTVSDGRTGAMYSGADADGAGIEDLGQRIYRLATFGPAYL